MPYRDLYADDYRFYSDEDDAMPLRRMFDAAFPPPSPPPWEVAAGYIGGNTPHVWTDAEWARQSARWRLPIFTRSTGGDPNIDGAAAVRWLRAHGVPPGCCVGLDFETRIDPGYLRTFDQVVVQAGWRTMVYGTRRTVVQNPEPSGGYWMAEWTGTPHLIPGSAATQWSGSGPFGGAYDPNLVADTTPLWDTQEGTMSAAGPEHWDDADWKAFDLHVYDQAVKMMRLSTTGDAGVGSRLGYFSPLLTAAKAGAADAAAARAVVGELTDDEANILTAMATSGGQILNAVAGIPAGDPVALAAALAEALGPDLAGALAANLAERLQS